MTKNEIINYLNLKGIPYAAGIYLNKDRIYIHRYCNSDEYAHNNGFTICVCTFKEGNLIEFNSGLIGSFKDVVENIVLGVDKGLKLYNCPNDNPYQFKKLPGISSEIIDFIESSL